MKNNRFLTKLSRGLMVKKFQKNKKRNPELF